MSRTLLIHLSDLHLCQPPDRAPKEALWDSLEAAVATIAADGPEKVAVAITGDLVDSSKTDATAARDAVLDVVRRVRSALGRPSCPVVLLPGNHDRRSSGLVSPWSHELMGELGAALKQADATLFAQDAHEKLATTVPQLSEVLDAEVVVYDTTHTLEGVFSAGGLFRPDDLFAIPRIAGATRPVIVLLHHHLVPTPVTDVEFVASRKAGRLAHFFVETVLPRIVTFGNREELTMTALGAGTALTSLHALGSAVVVLHGHKHYPTARLMKSTVTGDGDVLLASAGSAGLLEPYIAAGPNDPAFLWPSFNALWMNGKAIDVETVFFSPDGPKPIYRQPLASAERDGMSWKGREVAAPAVARDEIVSDTATFTLTKGAVGYWDLACERLIVAAIPGLAAYEEPLPSTPTAELTGAGISYDEEGHARIAVRPNEVVRYRSTRALHRSLDAAVRELSVDAFSPFESIGLHVQRGTRTATMIVRGLADANEHAFATLTDLHTGQQRPLRIEPSGDEIRVVVEPCPARRLLRLYWPLEP